MQLSWIELDDEYMECTLHTQERHTSTNCKRPIDDYNSLELWISNWRYLRFGAWEDIIRNKKLLDGYIRGLEEIIAAGVTAKVRNTYCNGLLFGKERESHKKRQQNFKKYWKEVIKKLNLWSNSAKEILDKFVDLEDTEKIPASEKKKNRSKNKSQGSENSKSRRNRNGASRSSQNKEKRERRSGDHRTPSQSSQYNEKERRGYDNPHTPSTSSQYKDKEGRKYGLPQQQQQQHNIKNKKEEDKKDPHGPIQSTQDIEIEESDDNDGNGQSQSSQHKKSGSDKVSVYNILQTYP